MNGTVHSLFLSSYTSLSLYQQMIPFRYLKRLENELNHPILLPTLMNGNSSVLRTFFQLLAF